MQCARENDKNFSPIVYLRAVRFGHIVVVEELLERGADIEALERDGYSPFILAVKYDHASIANLLWEKGARVTAKDLKLKTALHHAVEKESLVLTKFLLEICKKLMHAKDIASHTPVHYAARDNNIKV